MATYYHSRVCPLRFCPLHIKCIVVGSIALGVGLALQGYAASLSRSMGEGGVAGMLFTGMQASSARAGTVLLLLSLALFAVAIPLYWHQSISDSIVIMVQRGLFAPTHGNPLHLKEGELLPKISCKQIERGLFDLTISALPGVPVDVIVNAAPSVSAALNSRFQRYAVTQTDPDIAFNSVVFRLDDVKIDRSITCRIVDEMRPKSLTQLQVDRTTYIDLTTSGSILVAGKTRSGKTTGIIALLIQALLCGRDEYESEIIVIDPKQAELSRLPHTISLDAAGEATTILEALKRYAKSVTYRQRVLNDLSEDTGDAVKWWDAGFHPSFLFVDEYVACRSIFPQKPTKDNDYCIGTFDGLIKRIITMGASAGCFVIISIAEASVQEGGLPAMLRAAMSTRVLFRPTMTEGRLIWDAEKLADFSAGRIYEPGDAWFSSTDGIHDAVSCVHFPKLEFPVYRELGALLQSYYSGTTAPYA